MFVQYVTTVTTYDGARVIAQKHEASCACGWKGAQWYQLRTANEDRLNHRVMHIKSNT